MAKLAVVVVTSCNHGLPGAGTCNGDTTCRDDFYSDPVAVGYYKDHVKMWLNRRNTFTGRLYRCAPAGRAGEHADMEPRRLGGPETASSMARSGLSRISALLVVLDLLSFVSLCAVNACMWNRCRGELGTSSACSSSSGSAGAAPSAQAVASTLWR